MCKNGRWFRVVPREFFHVIFRVNKTKNSGRFEIYGQHMIFENVRNNKGQNGQKNIFRPYLR